MLTGRASGFVQLVGQVDVDVTGQRDLDGNIGHRDVHGSWKVGAHDVATVHDLDRLSWLDALRFLAGL
ncbi:hypothetical protein CXY01_19000 [Cellulomonas xylanilytica]|uniref:Uncharacterized protein n=1 Tax=Cellulomonas xylanilytica TaxID=233583 RepID=A0A510V7Y5_9CELL|nr:hypothetical protein CXY01_19000 [Cellulomonas xylanilytica]